MSKSESSGSDKHAPTPEQEWINLVRAMVDAGEFNPPGPMSDAPLEMPFARWCAVELFVRRVCRQLDQERRLNAGLIEGVAKHKDEIERLRSELADAKDDAERLHREKMALVDEKLAAPSAASSNTLSEAKRRIEAERQRYFESHGHREDDTNATGFSNAAHALYDEGLGDALNIIEEVEKAVPSSEGRLFYCPNCGTDTTKSSEEGIFASTYRDSEGVERCDMTGAPAHTDHPARHFDRTCPACVAERDIEPDRDAASIQRIYDEAFRSASHDGTEKNPNLAALVNVYMAGRRSSASHARSSVAETQAAEIAELREKLAQYEVPARRRERLEQIVSFLFPKYDGRKGRDEGVFIHPDKSWWWNGAGIDENDVYVGDAGYGAQCKVSSYVGSGEYDSFLLEVPAAWMDAEDFRPLASKWITDETERRESAKKAAEKAQAERDLKDAQRRLDEAMNTPIAASATRSNDRG